MAIWIKEDFFLLCEVMYSIKEEAYFPLLIYSFMKLKQSSLNNIIYGMCGVYGSI